MRASYKHVKKTSESAVACGICGRKFPSRRTLHIHKAKYHYLVYGRGSLQESPFAQNENPFEDFPEKEEMWELYKNSRVYILQPHEDRIENVLLFNYPIKGQVSPDILEKQMREIYQKSDKAYKLELTAGVILKDTTDGSLRYFRPEANAYLFDEPLPIVDKKSMEAATNHIKALNIDDLVRSFRPSTKYVVLYITQLEWHAWKTNFALGARVNPNDIPWYIKRRHSIITEFDYAGFEQCCLFVCYSQFLSRNDANKQRCKHRRNVKRLLHKWGDFCRGRNIPGYETVDPAKFKGVAWKDIHLFEDCFQINVCILELKPDDTAENKLTSIGKYDATMYVNVWQNHLCWITDIDQYCQKYTCVYCSRMFDRYWNLKRHQKTCSKQSNLIFPRGAYRYHKSVFDTLSEIGIQVPKEDRFFSHLVCFDLEAILAPENTVTSSGKTTFHSMHKPISCSICSNVTGFTEPVCFVNPDPHSLVKEMFVYFDQIRAVIRQQTHSKWGVYLELLKERLQTRQTFLYEAFIKKNSIHPSPEQCNQPQAVEKAARDFVKRMRKYYMSDPLFNQYLRLYKTFYLYVNRVVITSFNGSSYDIPLLSSSLIKHFLNQEKVEQIQNTQSGLTDDQPVYDQDDEYVDNRTDGGEAEGYDDIQSEDDMIVVKFLDEASLNAVGKLHTIKRNNSYVSLSNNHYVMVDVCNWLPANTNYQSFVRAYASEGEKLFFPYEYLTHASKLNHPLPVYPSSAWESQLKGGIDILDEEYQEYLRNPEGKDPPKTGAQNYADIQKRWDEKGFTCLRDLLSDYNNADTKPMISALSNMQTEYFNQGLDLWKISLGCPGLARIMLMKHAQDKNILFPMIHPNDEDMFWMFKAATVGGPSIIYMRECQKGVTLLHPDGDKVCQSLAGYDANALYTYCLKSPMMTFMYVRRYEDENFKPRYRTHFFTMYTWLKFMSKQHKRHIRTRLSEGCDIRAGRYFLDGQSLDDKGGLVAYEYLGCAIHEHLIDGKPCYLAKNTPFKGAYKKWLEKKQYLEDLNYEVFYIWECSMNRLLKAEPRLREDVQQMKPTFLRKHKGEVTKEDILEGIRDESFFGFLVCDISVPLHLRSFMDSCPPLFSNTTLNMEDIGDVMREFATEKGIKIQNRRLLLSGMAAEEILLSSRLVAFYLELGLEVTRIYQTISYVKSYPFDTFVEAVTKHRKEAQKNPDRKMVGEIYKLMGECLFHNIH